MEGIPELSRAMSGITLRVAGLERRVGRLEGARATEDRFGERVGAATRLAAEMQISGDVFFGGAIGQRRRLSRALRRRGWALGEISRVIGCSLRTVVRDVGHKQAEKPKVEHEGGG